MVSPFIPFSYVFEQVGQAKQDNAKAENPYERGSLKKDSARKYGKHHGKNQPDYKHLK